MFSRIADFLQEGPSAWYEILNKESIMFYDGAEDRRESPVNHLRSFR